MKFTRKTVALIFAIAVLLGLSALFIPKLYKSQLKSEIIYLADKNLDANVTFDDFDLDVFSQFPYVSISLKNLAILGEGTFAGDTLVHFPKIALAMNLKRYIMDHEIHISQISLDSPFINVWKLANGTQNWDIYKENISTKDTTAFYLDVDKVSVSNGKIRWNDEKAKVKLAIDQLNHRAKWDINKSIFDWETHTKIGDFTLDYDGIRYLNKKETEMDIVMEVDTEKSLLTFKDNNIRINHFNFSFDGSLGMNDREYVMDIRFSAKETLFKHLLSILPGVVMKDLKQLRTDGDMAFDGFIKGIYNDSLSKLPSYRVNLKVIDASIQFDSLPIPAKNIDFHLIASNPDGIQEHTFIDLKSFSLNLGQNSVRGFMKIYGLKSPKFHGELKSTLDLNDIRDFYPLKTFSISGWASMDLKINGIYDKTLKLFPNLNATFQLENGFLLSQSHPEPLKNIHLLVKLSNSTGKIQDSNAQIEQLTFSLEDEPFDIKGSITNFEELEYDFELKGRVDLEKMTKIYPLDGLKLTGIVHSDLKSKGKFSDIESGKYEKTVTEGIIDVYKFRAEGNSLALPLQVDTAYIQFSPTKISLPKLEGYLGKSDFKITGELTNYMAFLTSSTDIISGNVNLKSDSLSLNEWFSNNKPKSIDSSTQLKLIEVPKNLSFVFDSDIGYLRYDDFHITHMVGEVKIKDGMLSLNETGFNSLNAKFKINGDYNTANIQKPFFDFQLNVQELDINKAYKEIKLIQQLAPAAKDAYGTISIDYKLKADLNKFMQPELESMEGGGSIRIHEAKIDGIKIMDEISQQSQKSKLKDGTVKDFVMESEIKGSKLIVKPFTMKLSDFHTEIQGTNDLSGKIDYLVKVSLIPFEGIKLPFHITGTYSKPKIALGKGR
ncbi:MAG: AsmA family protein [Cytophagales bacterium]|nr:AsmA family protein [Cytophagales bacterium]